MVKEQGTSTNNIKTYHSDENAILQALKLAIQDVMRYEGKLLEIKCSERAIIHWLATYCDYNRIQALVYGNDMITPQYQFGAAVHIYDVNKATIYFFTRDKLEPTQISVTL